MITMEEYASAIPHCVGIRAGDHVRQVEIRGPVLEVRMASLAHPPTSLVCPATLRPSHLPTHLLQHHRNWDSAAELLIVLPPAP
jgi:hypothetical protein